MLLVSLELMRGENDKLDVAIKNLETEVKKAHYQELKMKSLEEHVQALQNDNDELSLRVRLLNRNVTDLQNQIQVLRNDKATADNRVAIVEKEKAEVAKGAGNPDRLQKMVDGHKNAAYDSIFKQLPEEAATELQETIEASRIKDSNDLLKALGKACDGFYVPPPTVHSVEEAEGSIAKAFNELTKILNGAQAEHSETLAKLDQVSQQLKVAQADMEVAKKVGKEARAANEATADLHETNTWLSSELVAVKKERISLQLAKETDLEAYRHQVQELQEALALDNSIHEALQKQLDKPSGLIASPSSPGMLDDTSAYTNGELAGLGEPTSCTEPPVSSQGRASSP